MKKFKFFVTNADMEIIHSSNGYFDILRPLPNPFTIDDVKKIFGNGSGLFSAARIKRMEHLRPTTLLKLTRLCGWSSASGGPEYLVIKMVDDSTADRVDNLKYVLDNIDKRLVKIDEEIDKVAGPLVKEKKDLLKQQVDLKKKIKEFNETGELS